MVSQAGLLSAYFIVWGEDLRDLLEHGRLISRWINQPRDFKFVRVARSR